MNRQLLELLQKYPNAPIYTFTYCDVVGDDYGYWLGEIEKVYYGKVWFYNENFWLNENDLIEQIEDYETIKDSIEVKQGIIILINV